MKKTLLVLSITLFALPCFLSVYAQTLSSSPTLSFTNATGFADQIAQDGDGGSVAISDINIQVMPINSSGGLLTADPLEYHDVNDWGTPPIISYGGTLSFYGWSIKSDNGADFSLVSVDFNDWGEWSGASFAVQAYRDGASLGTVSFNGNTDNSMVQLSNTGVLTSIFLNVDEVRLYKQSGDSWTGLNNIKVASPASSLPVTWLDFTASRRGTGILLNWSTATEQNTKDYVVQHSANGRNWNDLTTLAASGNSTAVQQYTYLHSNILSGVHYYRILQRDMDGKESYSKVLSVDLSDDQKPFSVYPNPVVNGRLIVKLEKQAEIAVFNTAGVLVMQTQLDSGVHELQLPRFANGLYTVRAGEETRRFVVQW